MSLSLSRQILAIAGLSVGLLVGSGLAAGDLGSVNQTSAPTSPATNKPTAATGPSDTVYVRPAPAPAIIHITKPAPTLPPQVVRVVVPGSGGGEGDDNGGDNNSSGDGG